MAFQSTNDAAATKWSMPRATKRRICEEDDNTITYEGVKRLSCQHERSVDMATSAPQQQQALPSITYASPDYRPPPRSDALWLQPVQPAPSTMMMDEEHTHQEALFPLPSTQQHQPNYTSSTATVNLMGHHHSSFSQVQA
ncbi:hypothetical protein K492DRAFT_205386 [Lichtheimia hyalospora FSU 10163]|nr:hypothetical protein K492DRAFT_205386 [Lichtheimia hyalospora FSU 10163]